MHLTCTTPADEGWSCPRWVVAELDVRGELDAHAELCLRIALDAARDGTAAVLVDLRDLTAIDAAAVAMLVRAATDCRGRGIALGLLLCGHAGHDAIADAFAARA
jgi:anti-anti-sigma factor